MTRMFQINGKTVKRWPILKGKCLHDCVYCWVQDMCNQFPYMKKKYSGPVEIDEKQWKALKTFKEEDVVFVAETNDLFAEGVNTDIIADVLEATTSCNATFMFCTKNPKRYETFPIGRYISSRDILGCTIETTCSFFEGDDFPGRYEKEKILLYSDFSKAPLPSDRLKAMQELNHPRKMISVEPILDFSPDFASEILKCKPEFVYVGYDSKGHKLPEPSLAATQELIWTLRREDNIKVYEKELRPAWWENEATP